MGGVSAEHRGDKGPIQYPPGLHVHPDFLLAGSLLHGSTFVNDQRCVHRADRDYEVLGDSVWPPLSGSKPPPHLEWRAFAPSPGTYWTVREQPLKVSSVFSGIGSEMAALNLLLHEHEPGDVAPFAIVHSATFELRAAARDTLLSLSDCPLFGDLMELLPLDVKSLVCHKDPPSPSVLEKLIIGNQVALSPDAWCYRLKRRVIICMGDIAVCGVPCIDFSPMGLRRGLDGPTASVLVVWVRLLQIHQPMFIILEEVVQFRKRGLSFIEQSHMLGGLYRFEVLELNPRHLGLPISRPRVYSQNSCQLALPFLGGSGVFAFWSEVRDERPRLFVLESSAGRVV